ncbi:MAG: dinitrogenase iron-molybdenum cofactor biosynthesis protein [Clostridiales Family XIII bacterium]|jgi:predicted Fe-Mo cluster-binding NifX family protein|nr:dinitrogenase iron-molybdenum cofactor biosynthesis protein [Clostridiales Family XIII bacterium]
MTHRIAVTTTDRLTVFLHFGRAESFHIVDIDGDAYRFVEVRHAESACGEGGHDVSRFDAILELLSDCEAIVTGKIGPGAQEYLLRRGMRVFESPGVIDKDFLRNKLDKFGAGFFSSSKAQNADEP